MKPVDFHMDSRDSGEFVVYPSHQSSERQKTLRSRFSHAVLSPQAGPETIHSQGLEVWLHVLVSTLGVFPPRLSGVHMNKRMSMSCPL